MNSINFPCRFLMEKLCLRRRNWERDVERYNVINGGVRVDEMEGLRIMPIISIN